MTVGMDNKDRWAVALVLPDRKTAIPEHSRAPAGAEGREVKAGLELAAMAAHQR